MILASLPPGEVARVNRLLGKISLTSGKELFQVVRQTAIFAIQSAAKATVPGRSGTADSMAKKYKRRPILSSSAKAGYYYELDSGKTFRSDAEITPMNGAKILKSVKRRLSKVVKFWNKELPGWDYTAYTGSPEQEKFMAIPHYGAAKVGWYGSLGRLGAVVSGTGANKAGRLSKMSIVKSGDTPGIRVVNMVDYAAKTSPGAALAGLANAEKRMVKTYEKKLNTIIAGIY